MTEQELKEKVKKLLCLGFCGEDDSTCEDLYICSPLCKENQQDTADSIHQLYLDADYIQLTSEQRQWLKGILLIGNYFPSPNAVAIYQMLEVKK